MNKNRFKRIQKHDAELEHELELSEKCVRLTQMCKVDSSNSMYLLSNVHDPIYFAAYRCDFIRDRADILLKNGYHLSNQVRFLLLLKQMIHPLFYTRSDAGQQG